ncbi:MAG TPA: hypothetical protein VFZ59_09660, partial [Verrucomicrobiae bacterium]|nr:hypothetical protein [Verrucomicrobiae bacterium]
HMAHAVTTLRAERGYSATKHDGSTGEIPKIVRRQFGRFYDGKKVHNNEWRADGKAILEKIRRAREALAQHSRITKDNSETLH